MGCVVIRRADALKLGLKHYFTGVPCKYGHVEKRYTASSSCIICDRAKALERSRQPEVKAANKKNKMKESYKEKSREYAKARSKGLWSQKSTEIDVPSSHPDYGKLYYLANRERLLSKQKEYAKKNKDRRTEYIREWARNYSKTPEGVVTSFMRKSLNRCLVNKTDRSSALLGYSKEDLISHISSRFSDGMGWHNRGEWHIDHVVPIRHFLSIGVTDPKVINALSNLQPLWAKDNLSKGGKL